METYIKIPGNYEDAKTSNIQVSSLNLASARGGATSKELGNIEELGDHDLRITGRRSVMTGPPGLRVTIRLS